MKNSFLYLLSMGLMASSLSWGACLKDVEGSFKRLSDKVTPLSIWTDDLIANNMYMQKLSNKVGLNTHFQGLVRIPDTSRFILSGGDFYSRSGHLFVIDIASQTGNEFLEKNFSGGNTKSTPDSDKIVSSIVAGTQKSWHIGGLAVMENILVVPVENAEEGSSVVDFYDISNSEFPLKLNISIKRENFKTGSVIIFRNSENKIIVGANADQRKLIEIYESKTTDILDGFKEKSVLVDFEANGQGSSVVTQCDGKKFIVDFNNTSFMPPIIWGKDFVRLYAFDEKSYSLVLRANRRFDTDHFCNFKASGSATVTESGKLAIYGSHFYRHGKGKRIKLCQFSEILD